MNPTDSPTIFIVDDDPAIRDSLALYLGLKGYRIQPFASAEDFLATYRADWPGCLVLDLRMAGMDGLTLQATLKERGMELPIIVITAYGDIATARNALKGGAVDFIEKPIDVELLTRAISEALALEQRLRAEGASQAALQERLTRLTDREREVLELVVLGCHNREIAAQLGISPRTVEVYKARIMEKCQVQRFPELVRLVLKSQAA
ncbi:MAG: response regulator transcription factor [Gammaproteobacteria bacterium]|nr:response regulator transcription factor [Gammaproteobacteria bacterium]